jgi:4-hydroxy-4-methyl-2-oxoglutarate aldolase
MSWSARRATLARRLDRKRSAGLQFLHLNDQVPRDLSPVERLERLYPAVVADCLDSVGLRNQVMEPHIRPLYPSAKLAGHAMTVHCVEVDAPPGDRGEYYKGELQAVDALRPGDVMIVSTCRASYWGELLATASRYRGARGIVADAYTRDTLALIEMEFPTFAAGISAYDSLGRIDVDKVGVPIECGGVTVEPGDLVLADHDGVVVLPAGVAGEVLTLAEEKVSGENLVREKLAEGMPVWEAFQTYGVI